jgi:hypothetical protein
VCRIGAGVLWRACVCLKVVLFGGLDAQALARAAPQL